MIYLIDSGLCALTFISLTLMMVWLRIALGRAGFTAQKNKWSEITLAIVLGWLAFTAYLASCGMLAVWDSIPPRVALVPLTAFVGLILINRTARFKNLLAVTPRHWPVAMQSFRIFVELVFWALFLASSAPVQVTFEGRNFDILVGLTSPLVAMGILKFNLSARAVILWNGLGLLILLNTIITVITSTPGVLHLNWPGQPFTAFATWPVIWIPAFLAPIAIFLHVFSIRQNLALIERNR